MPATAPLTPPGITIQSRGIREFIVGTGGETLDTVVTVPTSATDTGATFNAANLEAATGDYWGVMALTLDEHGYKWDFESALELPGAPAGDLQRQGLRVLPRFRQQVICRSLSLTFPSAHIPHSSRVLAKSGESSFASAHLLGWG